MIRLEFLRWIRSKRYLILILIFSIFSLISTLSSYYSKDIIEHLGTNGAQIIMPKVTWKDLITSYLKSTSQICVFVAVYIVSLYCRFGENESEKLFYKTRIRNSGRVLFSKLMVSVMINLFAMFIGALFTLYIIWTLFDNFDFEKTIVTFFIQMLTFTILIIVGTSISVYSNSPFFSAVIMELFILASSIVQNIDVIQKWSPFNLLIPNDFLNEISFEDYKKQFMVLFLIFIISILAIRFRPINKLDISFRRKL
ncbi:hypothetical protein ACVR0S_05745 [Streptococcus dentapri]|uniref:ABC-2 family transporter protein n=1 Tax=Streptococcus dentapri TaxID=573564 RepID=A0ABV8CZ28_9STRE